MFGVRQVDTDARGTYRRSIDQRVTAGTDHGTHSRRADYLAQTKSAKSGGKHFCIRRRSPVLQNDLRSKETGKGTPRRLGTARLPYLVLALDEDREQLLLNVAAAVPPLINDHRFLISIFTYLFFKLPERGLIHRLYV